MNSEEFRRRLRLLLEPGPGLVVIETPSIHEGHLLVDELRTKWDVEPVTADVAFDPLDGRARVIWDLPFVEASARRRALVMLNRARDRLASLPCPVLLWLLEQDLSLGWDVAQDLLDWAQEILTWSSLVGLSAEQAAGLHLPPRASPAAAVPSLVDSYAEQAMTGLALPGARLWIEAGAGPLVHAAVTLAELLRERGRAVVVIDLERADVERAQAWLRPLDPALVVILIGGFMTHDDLPSGSRAVVFVRQCSDPPEGWTRVIIPNPTSDWFDTDLWLSPILTLRVEPASAADHQLEPLLGLAQRSSALPRSPEVTGRLLEEDR